MKSSKLMWLDNESRDAIDLFWKLAGEIEDIPRNLERPIALALPVSIVKLPHLGLSGIERWLRLRKVQFSFNCVNRAVHGCLIAYAGKGIIFVDGGDQLDEIRFSIAHEAAHFILDYWLPRQKTIREFGPSILEVLDGFRKPSVNERLYSILYQIKMGTYIDLMERNPDRGADLETWRIEDQADRVALALLADPEDVLAWVSLSTKKYEQRCIELETCLTRKFGLPATITHKYAVGLLEAIGKGPTLAEALRMS